MGPLGHANFHANRCTGVGMRPQKLQISTFGKESPYRSEPLEWYPQLLGASIRPTIPHLCFTFDVICFRDYGLLSNRASVIYPEFFRAPCRKKYASDRKKLTNTFLLMSTSSITMQSLWEIDQCVPAVGETMWCLYVFFFCLEPGHYCDPVYDLFFW